MVLTGYIYKITQNCDEKKINYIGSTFRTPKIRYLEHKRWSKYNLWNSSSCEVLFNEKYDELPVLEVLEELIFLDKTLEKSKSILRKLEFSYIQNTENNINKIKKIGNPNTWYGKNKEMVEKKRKANNIVCECGSIVNYHFYKKHLQTKKHNMLCKIIEKDNIINNLKKSNDNLKKSYNN